MTKTKSTTVKHKPEHAKAHVMTDEPERMEKSDELIGTLLGAPIIAHTPQPNEATLIPVVSPKERLLFAAAVIDDLLPTYSGPGRRYLEAVKINLEQAIKYTP